MIIVNKQLNSSGCCFHGNHSHNHGKNYGSNYLHQLQVAPTHVITLLIYLYLHCIRIA
jgi:hypothetical protein